MANTYPAVPEELEEHVARWRHDEIEITYLDRHANLRVLRLQKPDTETCLVLRFELRAYLVVAADVPRNPSSSSEDHCVRLNADIPFQNVMAIRTVDNSGSPADGFTRMVDHWLRGSEGTLRRFSYVE